MQSTKKSVAVAALGYFASNKDIHLMNFLDSTS